jgi:phosphatidylglycerophosphate synthase
MPRATKGIDKYVYLFIDKIIPFFCKNNIHPNIITSLNIINNIFLFENLKQYDNKQLIIFQLFIYFFFDCLDGQIARACNKQSDFGGYYDFISDIFFQSILLLYLICKYIINDFKYFTFEYMAIIFMIIFIIYKNQFNFTTHKLKKQDKIFEELENNYLFLLCFISYLILS